MRLGRCRSRSGATFAAVFGVVVTASLLSALGVDAAAQALTPAVGGGDRRAIFEAMRAVGEDHRRVFVPRTPLVEGEWAWLVADPRSVDGRNPYDTESALLRRSAGGWAVVDQPCGEADCDAGAGMARIRGAHPEAPADIFPE